MKNIIIIAMAVMLTNYALAQSSTKKMSYQAIIRNSSNVLVQNRPVGIKISILETSITGPAVYVETHTKPTNQNGLLVLQIGGGTVLSGVFNDIDWGVPRFLKTEIDPLGGTNYSITTTSELLSVPLSNYSNYSNTSNYAYVSGTANTLNGVAWKFVGAYLGVFEGYSYINYIGANKITFTYTDPYADNNLNGKIDRLEYEFNKTIFGTVTGNIVTFPPQGSNGYIMDEITGTLVGNKLTLTSSEFTEELELIKQ